MNADRAEAVKVMDSPSPTQKMPCEKQDEASEIKGNDDRVGMISDNSKTLANGHEI